MDIGKVRLDIDACKKGVWFKIGPEAKILIARHENENHLERMEFLARGKESLISRNMLPREELIGILHGSLVGTVLLDWEGITENGKPLPYSEAAAKRLLTDPEYQLFQEKVLEFAKDQTAFRKSVVEEDEKKSENTSGGARSPKAEQKTSEQLGV